MKIEIANKDLKPNLDGSMSFRGVELSGEITLALVKNRKKLVAAHLDFTEAYEEILTTRCLKDENAEPILQYQKDQAGNDITDLPKKYSFENDEVEKSVIGDLIKLSSMKVELDVDPISENSLKNIPKITPEQMDILMLFVSCPQ